ncbi:MAG TPA: type II toxin-antitoxin system HicB family antitoxin [Chitinophagales bacterium]|nr:type II toxin-antitoxin system HicB family antitoxin [Chitinophagales bacterium]
MKIQNAKTLHFSILTEQDEDGVYIVTYPSFQDRHSFGKTMDEVLFLEETPASELNKFIGFRKLDITEI